MTHRSLSVQMLFSLVCWATLILVLYASGMAWVYRDRAMVKLEQELALEAEQLETAVAGALWNYNTDQIDRVLDGVMKNRAITGVLVLTDGREFSRKRTEEDASSAKSGEPGEADGKKISISRPVRYMHVDLGTVSLRATTRFLDRDILRAAGYFAGTILVLDLALILGLYSMMSRVVISPIKKLEAYALAAGRGEALPPAPPQVFKGEMEVLRKSMARMLEELGRRYEEVQNEVRRFKDSEERFRILVNTIPDYIWVKDPEGIFLSCNKMFCTLLEAEESDILGRTDYDFVEESLADFFRENDRFVMETGETVNIEEQLPRKSDEALVLDTLKAPVYDAAGNLMGVLGIARDITSRLKAEKDRAKLKEQLNQAQKIESIGRLAGGVAHDFNNMLGVIRGNAELALAESGLTDQAREYINEVTLAADRSADLTRQLLAFARKADASPREINLNGAMDGMLKMLRRLIGEDIELRWTPGEDLWSVRMDPSQLDHILVNLCINARDAIPEDGKISIETRNFRIDEGFCESHPQARAGDFVRLTVGDNGEGISKEFMTRIFDPFFTTKGEGKGTGLGLSMVHGVVRQNDGFITVYSEPGMGAVFHLYLPRCLERGEAVPEGTGDEISLKGTETVLVVEDEASILLMIRKTLENQGYTVLATESPTEAVEIAANFNSRIDLLLTDVIMPRINGRDLASIVKKERPGIQVLFMSGYTADVIQKADIDEMDAGFIQKPFSNAELLKEIRTRLGAV